MLHPLLSTVGKQISLFRPTSGNNQSSICRKFHAYEELKWLLIGYQLPIASMPSLHFDRIAGLGVSTYLLCILPRRKLYASEQTEGGQDSAAWKFSFGLPGNCFLLQPNCDRGGSEQKGVDNLEKRKSWRKHLLITLEGHRNSPSYFYPRDSYFGKQARDSKRLRLLGWIV